MGKYKGQEARYNVISVRLNDEVTKALRSKVKQGDALSDYLRELILKDLEDKKTIVAG